MVEDDDDRERQESTRRAAQGAAAELSRMGIDPRALGLDAVSPPPPPAPPPGGVTIPAPPPGRRDLGPSAGLYQSGNGAGGQVRAVARVAPADPTVVRAADRPTLGTPPPAAGSAAGPAVMPVPVAQPTVARPASPDGVYRSGQTSALHRSVEAPNAPARAGSTAPVRAVDALASRPTVPSTPAGLRSLARAAALGLVQPNGANALRREKSMVARTQTGQRGHRSVVFLAGKGGVGTSTAAAAVGSVLTALRRDRVALVDIRAGAGSLGRRVARRPAPMLSDLVQARQRGARIDPLWLPTGLGVVDGAPWHSPVGRGELLQLLDDLQENNAFTLLDVGNDTGDAAYGALGRCDQVVVVTPADENAVDATRVALGRVYQLDPRKVDAAMIAVVCLSKRAQRSTVRTVHRGVGLRDDRLVVVPYDPALDGGSTVEISELRNATRQAFLTLAAAVADPARGNGGAR